MQEIISNYLAQMKVGQEQSYGNLTMFPILSPYAVSVDYITLDEALNDDEIEVVEVSEFGSVPELKVLNKSSKMILILDGEELVGAKQNRIINTTILMQAGATTMIPVSCVEQGRWSYKSHQLGSQKRMMSPGLRAMKAKDVHDSVRLTGTYCSDQGAIWNEISEMMTRMAADSPTMAMADIYEKEKSSIQDYVKHFRQIDTQVGAAFAINGNIVGMDCFGKPETFKGVFKKLAESYALDAIDWVGSHKGKKATAGEATDFLQVSSKATTESRPSVAMGTDYRLESEVLTGLALALDDQVLHLSVFSTSKGS